jgi:hypothetical protein
VKERLIAVAVILAIAGVIATVVIQKRNSPEAKRDQLVEQFIAILPDSLDNDRVLEIRKLFYMLYERERLGKVKPETSKEITDKLAVFVEIGTIAQRDLIYFMAEVGYNTYKDEKRYNLPDGSNDNPILNPSSAMVTLGFDSTQFDSTFWADFEKWKKENPELVDSIMKEELRR